MNSILVLQSQAIKAAQENRLDDAISFNTQIIENDPQNISAMNRLGFCYMQIKDTKNAKKTYQQALKLDPYNPIAKKYLSVLEEKQEITIGPAVFNENFIEEPGKTKTLQLCRVADPSILNTIAIGTPCKLEVKKFRIAVATEKGTYVGSLPDDLSHHLSKLIECGNTYKVVVKAITKTGCTVFMKELSRGKKCAYITSFPLNSHANGVAHNEAHDELLIEQAPLDLSETGQEDEGDELLPVEDDRNDRS